MAFKELFTDVITKLESLLKDTDDLIPSPKPSANFQQTASNVNRIFKTINIFNDQIDNEIKEKGYIIKCPAVLIEFLPEEPKMILGGVTQYMEAKMYFHIYSDQLNSPNRDGGDFLDRNVEIYDLRDVVKTNMLGFHTHNSSYMMSRYDALDYRHGSITKYLLGFTFCFNDDKGSIFDKKSSRYLVYGTKSSDTASVEIIAQNFWISGNSYTSNISAVYFNLIQTGVIIGYYICTTTNNDSLFTPENWQYLAIWVSAKPYSVGQFIYLGYYAYQCTVSNSDIIFNESNWRLICRI